MACAFRSFAATFTCGALYCGDDHACCIVDRNCTVGTRYSPLSPLVITDPITLVHTLPPIDSITFRGNGLRQLGLVGDQDKLQRATVRALTLVDNPTLGSMVYLPTSLEALTLTNDPRPRRNDTLPTEYAWPPTLTSLRVTGTLLPTDAPLPPSLGIFDCTACGWSSIPAAYPWPANLTEIHLRANHLEGFSTRQRWPLTLQILDVSLNEIASLDGLPTQLATLNVSGNRLSTITIGTSYWATTMDFSNNARLQHLTCTSPQAATAFTTLNVEGCPLAPLHVDRDCKTKLQTGLVLGSTDAATTRCEYKLVPYDGAHLSRGFQLCLLPGTYSERTWRVIVFVESLLTVVFGTILIVARCYPRCVRKRPPPTPPPLVVNEPMDDDPRLVPLRAYRVDAAHLRIDEMRPLGRGAHGLVVYGQYKRRHIAVKRVRADMASPEILHAFVQEVALNAILHSPYIVDFVGVYWSPKVGLPSLACLVEYMALGDLRACLQTPQTPTWKLGVAHDVAHALYYLHKNGVVHRDLKSRNVLLGVEGGAKVGDMGVARRVFVDESDDTLTNAVGTYRWTAPEVLRGTSYDTKADMYSFGMILTELDSYALPYEHVRNERGQPLGNISLLFKVMEGTITPTFTPTCAPWLRDLATACSAHDPSARPSAADVLLVLARLAPIKVPSEHLHGVQRL
ncbi:TKL protein kinase, variant [Saprolegnia diclina VS20]|uniref:TKL protein kinase, variant n=1 Tax=Saprolegnia diclina (strain VS20) TaxID=1156394 RepID=T0QL90_SAPDV|nr:TKL protein kinase, variant [Saprolegnia diclina VS20]EQC35456.1 TKL protein kinase, variant [Saprolegnia diclina VS20]|eukprot:XP_008611206.1 TKL protein kinase, variant [Saprolegnia diclina VS20]